MRDIVSLSFPENTETAILAGGSFWGLEAVYQAAKGVLCVVPGYTGGSVSNPSYNQVCSGETGHFQAVRIHFDPEQISYRNLLEIFFIIHDPTQRDRQGNDIGPQYRSAIFWADERQQFQAMRIIEELRRIRAFLAPIVTETRPVAVFFPAERYHWNYYKKNGKLSYCQQTIQPKLERFRAAFPSLYSAPQ